MASSTTRPGRRGPLTVPSAVLRFAVASVAAVAVVAGFGYFALRSVATDEAQRDTRERILLVGQLLELEIPDAILTRDPAAVEAVDDFVNERVLTTGSVTRVNIWGTDGTILYSDEESLRGQRFALDAGQRELLREGGAEVEVSDLSGPENAFNQGEGELIEAYTAIRTPSGEQVLFEIYERVGVIDANVERILRALAPPLLAGLLVLLLVQTPLAWSMARGLQRGHREREALLQNALEASNRERRRIASHLHDGAVQELAGTAFGLSPLAERADARGDAQEAAEVRESVQRLRQTIRDLRTLLVELHPANLEASGLEAALSDLASPLQAKGIDVAITVEGEDGMTSDQKALVNRVAQEALRNVLAHSGAARATVDVTGDGGTARLAVVDDGNGFDDGARERRREDGHLGLTLLEELVAQSGGRLGVRSSPGEGTRVELEVPAR